MYDRILLPTDGSAGTARVADHAIDLATRYDATIDVLSVIEVGDALADPGPADRENAGAEAAGRATRRLVDRAEAAGVTARAAVREGQPHRELLDHVEAADVDLIVMGTHGRSGVGRVLLGSVTERIVRLSPVPVLTVGLADGERRVRDRAAAEDLACEAVRRAGHELGVITDVYEERGTWVVSAETADGTRLNVHIDAGTRETNVATLNGN